MPHDLSENSSNQPDGPKGSPRYTLDPLRPPGPSPPHRSPRTPRNRFLGLIELLRSPQLPFKSSEDPSNVAVDPVGGLTPPF